jgi:LTXXQ motif family protein
LIGAFYLENVEPNTMKKRTLLALLAAVPAVAFGQMGGRPRRGGDKSAGGAKGGAQINPVEATLGEFETDLKLTGDQQKAWNTYADGIRALQKDIARDRAPRASDAQLDLAKRLDRAADVARDRLTAVEDIVDSAKGLLKTLTPEQRTMADPRLASLIGMSFGEACGSGAKPPAR